MMLCCDELYFNSSNWCISILVVYSVICSLGGPLLHSSPVVVFFDRAHPRFWNFYFTIPIDVVRVKSYIEHDQNRIHANRVEAETEYSHSFINNYNEQYSSE